jgi:hypothetical protein
VRFFFGEDFKLNRQMVNSESVVEFTAQCFEQLGLND